MNAVAQTLSDTSQDDEGPDIALMRHRLRAQLINTKGLKQELDKAVTDIKNLLEGEQSELPAEFAASLSSILDNDLSPCLSFLDRSCDVIDTLVLSCLSELSSDTHKHN